MFPYPVTIGEDYEENAHDGKNKTLFSLQEYEGIATKAAKPDT